MSLGKFEQQKITCVKNKKKPLHLAYFVAMATIYSVELCQRMVDKAQAALEKAMEAESYSIGGRSLSRAKVKDCEEVLDLWLGRLATAQGKRRGKSFCVASIPH